MVIQRYVQFVQKLTTSKNPVIWQLSNLSASTVRSTMGLNVHNIRAEFKLDPLEDYKKMFCVAKAPLPEDGEEKLELLANLLQIKENELNHSDCDDVITELDEVIFNVSTS